MSTPDVRESRYGLAFLVPRRRASIGFKPKMTPVPATCGHTQAGDSVSRVEPARMSTTGSRRSILVGASLCVLPTLAAALLLMAGVASAELTLVYVSIAVSVAALPAFVYGVITIIRAVAQGRTARTG